MFREITVNESMPSERNIRELEILIPQWPQRSLFDTGFPADFPFDYDITVRVHFLLPHRIPGTDWSVKPSSLNNSQGQ